MKTKWKRQGAMFRFGLIGLEYNLIDTTFIDDQTTSWANLQRCVKCVFLRNQALIIIIQAVSAVNLPSRTASPSPALWAVLACWN